MLTSTMHKNAAAAASSGYECEQDGGSAIEWECHTATCSVIFALKYK